MSQTDSVITKVITAFTYLFKPGFLVYMAAPIISVALIIVLHQFALILIFIASIAFMYKCYDSAYAIVDGNDEEVSFSLAPNINFSTPLKLFLVYFIIAIVLGFVMGLIQGGLISTVNTSAAIIGMIIMGFSINIFFMVINPAITMIMIRSQSFRQTINPGNWIGFIQAFGTGRYFLMVGILFAMSIILVAMMTGLSMLLPNIIGYYLLPTFIYSVIIGFQFVFVAYCSRRDLVQEVSDTEDVEDVGIMSINKGAQEDLKMAADAWRAGHKDDAIQLLVLTIDNESDWSIKMPLVVKLFQYYDEIGQPQRKAKYENQLYDQIANNEPQHFSLIQQSLKDKVARGEKLSPQQVYPLAELSLNKNDAELAIKLTSGFNKLHPNHNDVSKNLFIAAKAYTALRMYENAYKITAHLIKAYPSDPDITEFKGLFADAKMKIKAKQAIAKAKAEKNNQADN